MADPAPRGEETPPADKRLDERASSAARDGLRRYLADLLPPIAPFTWVAAIGLLLVLTAWLWLTPTGLLGKADAVGYAVCHRITVRSFLFPDGRQLPMCARCSGTFLGVLVGLLGPGLIFGRRRAGRFPPPYVIVIMLAFSAWWAFDGANSFAHLLPADLPIPRLFEPNNFLRVTTGMFHGITMGGLVLPIVNASLWAEADDRPTLAGLSHLLILYGVGVALIAMILSGWGVFLYPLAVASAVGAVSILTCVNLVMLAAMLKRENVARTPGEALPLIFLGLATALLLVGGIDAVRYWFFGSWAGLDLSQFGG